MSKYRIVGKWWTSSFCYAPRALPHYPEQGVKLPHGRAKALVCSVQSAQTSGDVFLYANMRLIRVHKRRLR